MSPGLKIMVDLGVVGAKAVRAKEVMEDMYVEVLVSKVSGDSSKKMPEM